VTGSRQYVRFLGLAVGLVVALCAVGYVPTRRLSGENGVAAMAAGCGISLVAAAAAGLLLTAVAAQTPEARMQRGFLAMVVRLAVVTVLGVAVVLSGAFARTPLLFWMATAYLVLLPLEVKLAIASE
jgi:L-cystine uptake protein TcyP (sodium:dicarboxylate symporter family)